MNRLEKETGTIILYEAPHRLLRTLRDLYDALGERKVALCKELTKRHENVRVAFLSEASSLYEEMPPKGEYVIVMEGCPLNKITESSREEWNKISIEDHLKTHMDKGLTKKEAMRQVANDRGVSRRDIYQKLI